MACRLERWKRLQNNIETREAKIGIIGMGAAGSMAGIAATALSADVALFDGNEKVGKKIYITGKGRCNVTNATPMPEFLEGIVRNPRFLYSALAYWDNEDTMDFFASHGQSLKVERGARVFPTSDHSSDIIRVLTNTLRQQGARLYFHHRLQGFTPDPVRGGFHLIFKDQPPFFVEQLILATGGCSYAVTGSDGAAYDLLKQMGHTIVPPTPSLVPLLLKEDVQALEGISLRNVSLTCRIGKRKRTVFGEMVFTRNGCSGPIILTLSAFLSGQNIEGMPLYLDWKPALDLSQLRERLKRERDEAPNRALKTLFASFLPKRAVPLFLEMGGWDPDFPFHSWSKDEQERFLGLLKATPWTVQGLAPFNQAVVTRGGVSVKEVDAKTMASKKIPGLYFAGEVLDIDGVTGGYNLQLAFSTGRLAGECAAHALKERA